MHWVSLGVVGGWVPRVVLKKLEFVAFGVWTGTVVLVGDVTFVRFVGVVVLVVFVGSVVLVGTVVLVTFVGVVVFVRLVGGGGTYLHYLALESKTVLRGQFTQLEVDIS